MFAPLWVLVQTCCVVSLAWLLTNFAVVVASARCARSMAPVVDDATRFKAWLKEGMGGMPAPVEAVAAELQALWDDGEMVLQLRAASRHQRRLLLAAGFRLVRASQVGEAAYAEVGALARLPTPLEWWAAGARRNVPPSFMLDLDEAERQMDLKDRGEFAESAETKRARTYLPVPWDPAKWVDTGLPAWVELMMQEGVRITPEVEPLPADHPFYKWAGDEALMRAIQEAGRHLAVGSLEYVPDDEVAFVAAMSVVHTLETQAFSSPQPPIFC